jgi:hypothetical protein
LGAFVLRDFIVLLFAVAGGLTLSGIVANLYRILGRKPDGRALTLFYYLVMVVAGPSVLFENATRSYRAKDCSRLAYGFAVTLAGYWAFALGLLILSLRQLL